MAHAGLPELSCFYERNRIKGCPGASAHVEHDVKTLASDVHTQNKIWMLPQPAN